MGCISNSFELHTITYLNEDEDKTINKVDVNMKTCQVCVQPFRKGKKNCCSTDCYLKTLQFKIDECFRDSCHTELFTS
jgi:hypothetical protein